MDKLSSVLPKVLHKRGIEKHATGALVVHRAKIWIVEHLAHLQTMMMVTKLQDGVLHISCTHSVAIQECQGSIGELMQYLRTECPFAGIKDIRVVRG